MSSETNRKRIGSDKIALPIGSINEKKDDSKHESASVEKSESSSIYSESIKSNEASIIEKGHGKHRKTTVLDFSEVNGTYFLPHEFHAIEIDKPQGQEQVAKQSSADMDLQSNDARNQEKDDEKVLGAIQRWSKMLFKSHHHHALPTYLKRYA